MPIKLTFKEYRVIGIVLLIAVLSLAVSAKYFWRAFPEASIDFKVGRDDSARVAEQFLIGRGFSPDAFRHASVFNYDDTAKLYLERTQGLERMNELTRVDGPVHLWRWSHRWFKPLEKEELQVEVTTAGSIAGFHHDVLETSPGANIDATAARRIAEDFLSSALGRNAADLEFLDGAQEKRPARTDHTLTWKDRKVDLGDGSQRIEVRINGDRVSGYREYVYTPEQWLRDYQQLRSRNESTQAINEVLWILLSVAMIVVLIRRMRRRDVPVRLSVAFGLVAAVLVFLDRLNSFSVIQFNYPTTESYAGFVAGQLLSGVLASALMGVVIFLMMAASEPVYRESFPQLPSIRRTFTWQGLRSRSFFMANVVGLGMTFFFFAYQTVFYLAANRLGAWSPSDVPFSDLINTSIPWVAVLLGGFAPSVMEEIQFRAFAIPFLQRVLRFWPLAIVLAAFNWGFLHAAYPNQPFFIRGVEVGLGGIIVGVIMLRFGVIATMIWHYSVDAIYTAAILLRSSNTYFVASGALTGGIMFIPLIIALVAYWRSGTFADEDSVTNAAEGTPPLVPKEAAVHETPSVAMYNPMSRRRVALAAVLAAVFVTLALLLPVNRFGEDVRVGVTRERATELAVQHLNEREIPAGNYLNAAWLFENVDPSALKYLFEHLSVQETDRIYRQATPLLLWHVRFYKPLEKEEHRVLVDASSGEVFSYRHLLGENAPGVSLSVDQARTIAEASVIEHGYSLGGFELQESQPQKRKAREDYTFVWQARDGDPRNVADARYRIQVEIAGDEVVGFNRFFKSPEDWLRRREASGIGNTVLMGISILVGGAVLGGILLLLVGAVRSGRIDWVASGKVGLVAAILTALGELGGLSTIGRGYNTSIPLTTFYIFTAVGLVVAPLLAGLGVWILVGLATSLYPEAWKIFDARSRSVWRRDAAIALVVGVAASAAAGQVSQIIRNRLHTTAAVSAGILPSGLDGDSPGLTMFFSAVNSSVALAAFSGTAIYLIVLGWRRRAWWLWAGAVMSLVALGPADAHSFSEYLAGWIINFIPLVLGAFVVGMFFRDNVLAYVAVGLVTVDSAIPLFEQPLAYYRWNGVLFAVLVLIVLAWLFRPRASTNLE